MQSRLCKSACVCFAAGMLASTGRADIALLGAVEDNTMYEIFDGTVSNGFGGYLFAGTTFSSSIRRGLIRFDLSSLPQDAVITDVQMTLHCSRSASLAQDVKLYRTLASWGEASSVAPGEGGAGAHAKIGDATWIHRFYSDVFWQNAGGDFSDVESATASVISNGFYTWAGDGMVQDAQGWLANSASNFGWTIRAPEDLLGTAKRFDSRENAELTFRPSLMIEYHIVPAPGGIAALGLAFGLITRRRR